MRSGRRPKPTPPHARIALASHLLVAGYGATIRYGDGTGSENTSPSYYELWRYPEYDARLGGPTGGRYQAGDIWRRDFACGYVTADPASHVGTIITQPTGPGCS